MRPAAAKLGATAKTRQGRETSALAAVPGYCIRFGDEPRRKGG
jgi:hypothetical protein